jgi:hypothetical protein
MIKDEPEARRTKARLYVARCNKVVHGDVSAHGGVDCVKLRDNKTGRIVVGGRAAGDHDAAIASATRHPLEAGVRGTASSDANALTLLNVLSF